MNNGNRNKSTVFKASDIFCSVVEGKGGGTRGGERGGGLNEIMGAWHSGH